MKHIYLLIFVILLHANNFGTTAYMSQVGQDQYLNDHFFKNKRNGFFVDIGAYDGITHSNTYFFEKELDWKGICFEPHPRFFTKLRSIRNCLCVNACVSNHNGSEQFIAVDGGPEELSGMVSTYDPRHLTRLNYEISRDGGTYTTIEVPTFTLNTILKQHDVQKIDYLSLDTEGSELEILKAIDFGAVTIDFISVENNYNDPAIRAYLESQGFMYITTLSWQDEIYRYIQKKN